MVASLNIVSDTSNILVAPFSFPESFENRYGLAYTPNLVGVDLPQQFYIRVGKQG